MILEKFFTAKYDNDTIFVNPDVTFGEFRRYVFAQKCELEKSSVRNVVLFCDDYFEYCVNFFGAVFARKNIFLLTDKTRLNQLDFEYILPQAVCPADGIFEGDFNTDKIVINLFTSGSCGVPKSIGKTFHNLETEAQCSISEFNLPRKVVIASTTSSSHSYGVAFNFFLPFFGGYRINRKKIEFPEQFDINEDYVLISTPSFMEKLAKYDFVFDNPPERIFLAGAKLKDEIYEYFSRFCAVTDIYGSTETGNIAYKCGGDVFTVLKDVDFHVDEDGRISVESDFFPAKKFVLNDVIEKISDEKFILKKRTDRLIKIQEKRISLDELENNLKKHSSVKDCHCFIYDEKLCCAAVVEDENITPLMLKNFLAGYSEILPKKWRIFDEIPKTSNGKIDSMKLKEIFGSNLSYPFVFSRRVDSQSAEIEMIFKKNSNFFRGHFDGYPVLPGVVQLYYAKFFAQDLFGIEFCNHDVRKVKFSDIMKPDTRVVLSFKNKDNSVEFAYKTDDKLFSSGILVK